MHESGKDEASLSARQAALLREVEQMRDRLCRGTGAGHEALCLLAELCDAGGLPEAGKELLLEAEARRPLELRHRLLLARLEIRTGCYVQAEQRLQRECSHDAAQPELWHQRGVAVQAQGRFEEALLHYERALGLEPGRLRTRFNRGLARLSLGRYGPGFRDLECRLVGTERRDRPLWLGKADLRGRRILLWADQGFGDSLQFVRYAPLLAARGARVLLQVQPALVRLFRLVEGVETVCAMNEPSPVHDFHCPFGSLPFALGTTPATLPQTQGYLAVKEGKDGEVLRKRRAARGEGGLRVGLCWKGNQLAAHDAGRRLPLPLCEELSQLPGIRLVSLCPEVEPDERVWLERNGVEQRDLCGDFLDTARMVQELDLVISVDTAVAHLTGGLGRPLWLVLSVGCDWRWAREAGSWYDSARLFRQDIPGEWATVVAAVAAALVARGAQKL